MISILPSIIPFLIMLFMGIISTLIVVTQLTPCASYDPDTVCRSFSAISLLLMTLSSLTLGTGLLGLIGYLIRWHYYNHEIFHNHFNTSLRQGFFLSVTLVIASGLLITNTFRWWTLLLLIGLVTLVELSFIKRMRM